MERQIMGKKEARESFNVKDLAHGLYLRDIINCMPDKTKLPYDETTYVSIVHQIIADYNDGLDKDKLGWFCNQHEQEDMTDKLPNLAKNDKAYASQCDTSVLSQWVIASALTVVNRAIDEAKEELNYE